MKGTNNLKQVRECRNISISALSQKLAYNEKLITAIETGGHIPSVYQAVKIAQALQVDVTDLFNVTDW